LRRAARGQNQHLIRQRDRRTLWEEIRDATKCMTG
jgi:hypothetical protein